MYNAFLFVLAAAGWCAAGVKGLPIVDYTSDNGLGYGVHLYVASGEAAGTGWRVTTEYYATTRGVLQPMVEVDLITASGLRVRGKAMYDRTLYTGYYGYGNTDEATGYDADFEEDYGYAYRRTNPYANLSVMVPLSQLPALGWFTGAGLAHYGISRAPKTPAGGTVPKLFTDAPEGVDGGMLYRTMVGVVYDTRDYEPNPHEGMYAEAAFEGGYLDNTYGRLTVTYAAYVPLRQAWPRTVMAARVIYDQLGGIPPFFMQETTGGLRPADALGGSGTVRGIPRYRYKGDVKLIATKELRMRLASVTAGGSTLHLENVFFMDLGNVWQQAGNMRLPLHTTYGIGPKILWGEDFIVSACFGFWRGELTGVYVNTGHQF